MQPGPVRQTKRPFAMDRAHRLLKRADFLRAYDQGRKAYGRHLTLFAFERPDAAEDSPAPWRLGVTATRKSGKSVQRNRQRRRIREFFRLHQRSIPEGWDFVVNTRRSLNEAGHQELKKDLEQVLRRLGVQMNSEAGNGG